MGTPATTTPALVDAELVAQYVSAHPEVLQGVIDRIPAKDRCAVAIVTLFAAGTLGLAAVVTGHFTLAALAFGVGGWAAHLARGVCSWLK